MPLTKTTVVVFNAQSFAGDGGSTPSTPADVEDAYAASYGILIKNGATGPTTPAEVQALVRYKDGITDYVHEGRLIGGVGNSEEVSSGDIPLGLGVVSVSFVVTHPTAQPVTITVEVGKATAL